MSVYKRLCAIQRLLGVAIRDTPVANANGAYSFKDHAIWVSERRIGDERDQTLCHELWHAAHALGLLEYSYDLRSMTLQVFGYQYRITPRVYEIVVNNYSPFLHATEFLAWTLEGEYDVLIDIMEYASKHISTTAQVETFFERDERLRKEKEVKEEERRAKRKAKRRKKKKR